MKKLLIVILLLFVLYSQAQVGIGTVVPDASSILDLTSTDKGFLVPRITTAQRNSIVSPALSLIIYNIDEGEFNSYNGALLGWQDFSSAYKSVSAIGDVYTNLTGYNIVPDMVLNPLKRGVYSVSFNSEYSNTPNTVITPLIPAFLGTAQAKIDLQAAYNTLNAMTTTISPDIAAAMGSGQTLNQGVYSFSSAASIATTLNLDAQNNPDALFVFKIGGAFAVYADVTIVLKNGAKASNIFWVTSGAPSIAARSIMKGTIITNAGAGSIAADCVFEGRMLTVTGAITCGPSTISLPIGVSPINLGAAANYAMFTGAGDITNTSVSTITGDIGTNLGALVGFGTSTHTGNKYTQISPTTPESGTVTTLVPNNIPSVASFSVYQNGSIIGSATKSLTSNASVSNVTLQAIAVVEAGQPIEIKWKTNSQKITVGNRSLTIIKVK